MAIPLSIEALLQGTRVETERVEFKETWDAQASLKTICAFANDLSNWGGGYIVIGVRENEGGQLDLVGVAPEKVDACLKAILNKSKLIQPGYTPITDVVEHEGKLFIVLWCPGGHARPYTSPKTQAKGAERVHWVRHMSATVAATNDEKAELYAMANKAPFDDTPNHFASIEDLDRGLMMGFLKDVGSALYEQASTMPLVDLCRSMHIVEGPDEFLLPLNVGLLFFSSRPEKFFPYAQIDIVEFPDGEGGDRLIEHTFKGPLHLQLREALRYLENNVCYKEIIKQPGAAPSLHSHNYPMAALQEALANAVYHKGYDVREPIEVRVLPDRITFLSFPGADRSIGLEGLKNFEMASRRYRNRRIGEFLKELGLTEGRNTGVHKILQALRQNNSPQPVFETDEERLYFMTTIYAKGSAAGRRFAGTGGASASSTRAQTAAARQAEVLEFFAQNPDATVKAASQILGIPVATLNRDIATLKAAGALRREGSRGAWVACLTDGS